MKRLLVYAAAAAMATCCCARDTNRYDSVVTNGGFEYSQRGGLGPSNFVVTAVSVPKLVSSMTNADSVAEFSAAVNSVAKSRGGVPPVIGVAEYLYEASFDDAYPDAAEEYYRSRGDGRVDGGCSAVRSGDRLFRNFDFPLDDRAEFIVRMSAGPGRFASVGVAQVGTNLTEEIVSSGKPSKWYRALPGATVDGINERGVVAEINVVDTPVGGWRTNATDNAIHPLGAIRWILDHATNALHAATFIAENIRFPAGWAQNFHYMVADAGKTWIVENGTVTDGDEYHEQDEPVTMTNFQLSKFPWGGMGMERFGLLLGGANITNAWYTRAYSPTANWASEFKDVDEQNSVTNAWADLRTMDARRSVGLFWQTVHTSVYDIPNRTLKVAVQERDDWYVFSVGATGGEPGGVTSVNGETGDVELTPEKIGALSSEADPAFLGWAAASTNSEGAVTNAVAAYAGDGDFRIYPDGRVFTRVVTPGMYVVEVLTNGYTKTPNPEYAGVMEENIPPRSSYLAVEYKMTAYYTTFYLQADTRSGVQNKWTFYSGNYVVGYVRSSAPAPDPGFTGTLVLTPQTSSYGPTVIRAYRTEPTVSWVETNVYDRVVSGSAEWIAFSNAVMRVLGR